MISAARDILGNGGKYPIMSYLLSGMISGLIGSIYPVILAGVVGLDRLIIITSVGSMIGFFIIMLMSWVERGWSVKKMVVFYMFFLLLYDFIVYASYEGMISNVFWWLLVGNSLMSASAMKFTELFEYVSMYQLGLKNKAKFTSMRTMVFHTGQIIGALFVSVLPVAAIIGIIAFLRIGITVLLGRFRDAKIERSFNFEFKNVGYYFVVILFMYLALGVFILIRGIYVDEVFGREWLGVYMAFNYSMLLLGVPSGIAFVVSGNIKKRSALLILGTSALFFFSIKNAAALAVFIIIAIFILNITIWGVRHDMFRRYGSESTHGVIFMVYVTSMLAKVLMSVAVIVGVTSSFSFIAFGGASLFVAGLLLLLL